MEAKLQSKLIKWLRSKGAFVMKVQAGPGVPKGTPDVFFCYEGFYGFCEVKTAKNSKFQVGQKEKIEKLNNWSWARVVNPDNYEEILAELELFF